MPKNKNDRIFTRRDFLKTVGIAGAGSLLAGNASLKAEEDDKKRHDSVPTRPFGKTGVDVPILSMGGIFDTVSNQLFLRQTLNWGVTYWDTAHSYGNGKSETGIGKYLTVSAGDRKKIFLVTKSEERDPDALSKSLNTSLERLKTDYVDLFFIHAVSSGSEVEDNADEWKNWAEKAKSDKKIRFFGFSTHKNMASCLKAASTTGWIDGIMTTYNYQLMFDDSMKAAVEACHKAGIGLTAMKTIGRGHKGAQTAGEQRELLDRFIKKGFTENQAKLKAVWSDERIVCICSQMPNMNVLMSSVAAAMDKTTLSAADMRAIQRYAIANKCDYCKGCSEICDRVAGGVPVADMLRYLMYHNSYGETAYARDLFAALPADIRSKLATVDFSAAERACPQNIAIGKWMKEAAETLG